jgi:hypothetical protein
MPTACLICKKEMTFAGLRYHTFSSFHANDIINSIHSKKSRYTSWLEAYNKNSKSCPFPKLYLTQSPNISHDFCYTCKKVRDVRNNIPLDCDESHKKASAEFIKECLAKEPTVVMPEEPEAPKVSDADLTALKKQVTRLQTQNESLKEMNAEASDDADALLTLLTHFQETDSDIFYQLMTRLKTTHPLVHERQLKNFEEEA